ncbi:MAG: hypothetical protein A2Y98_03900 [Candidatus Portnoybacteria bacterium RBG_19FT_COMBO_36_7]|uniref:Uncharacterized protein n=1 Tax=Candidatus Portnoybacteria bacterium RBG_19FT_COMBO_36_7 TaxID=1801992 RepID=A0A1G2F9K6_9BACT|nr:MAG: hypothetical protein A2Y98_03900 [Candidatus Portnoybacteria bacterium RBG_19FT_COMBO_36_7]
MKITAVKGGDKNFIEHDDRAPKQGSRQSHTDLPKGRHLPKVVSHKGRKQSRQKHEESLHKI